ncbi:MAG: CvpA family protein [Nitrosomonadales bacterium]|nr:CvpA family protein [Nitrosomonadales bacterium]
MTMFDYLVAGVLLFSIGLGVWRGLVYEVLSLLGWLAAYWVARTFAEDFVPYLPKILPGVEKFGSVMAFAALFLLTLIASGILAWLLSKIVSLVGLGWIDGLFGALFGALRGALIVLILVTVAGMTDLPQERFWRDARFSQPLQDAALAIKGWLPDNLAQRLHY